MSIGLKAEEMGGGCISPMVCAVCAVRTAWERGHAFMYVRVRVCRRARACRCVYVCAYVCVRVDVCVHVEDHKPAIDGNSEDTLQGLKGIGHVHGQRHLPTGIVLVPS